MKERIRSNLEVLEKEKIVTRRDNYQTMVNYIVQVTIKEPAFVVIYTSISLHYAI